MALRALSLFSGYGGIDLALTGIARTVAFVEREAYAAAILVARMEDGSLAQAPIWSDVGTFDGRPWRGVVDLIHGGFPCQPHSLAGKRLAEEDERWLWPDIVRILGEVRPGFVFLENVPGLLSSGFGGVLADLAEVGFDAEWVCVRASDVGAPHERERLFCLANTNDDRLEGQERRVMAHSLKRRQDAPIGGSDRWPAEPRLGRMANGRPFQVDRLRALGNGVVPQAARLAFDLLWERLN